MSDPSTERLDLAGARIFLTGPRGFLGRTLLRGLESRQAQVLVTTRAELDLEDRGAVREWLQHHRPDLVIHAAAVGGGIGWMREHPATAFTANILMNTAVIDGARRAGVRRLVGVSSACAYGRDAEQPMVESRIFEGEPEPTNGPYGQAKRMMLVQGAASFAEHQFDCAFAVPTNLYGPNDHFEPERSHVVAALVRRFDEARLANLPEVACWGSGRATRDLLYVEDAAEGVLRLLERGGGPAPVNLGGGIEHPVAAIAEAVATAVGYSGELRWEPGRGDGMPRKFLDLTRARQRLDFEPRVALAEGLAETVEWYRRYSR